MHTKVPFRRALDRGTSDEIAVIHYEWIKRQLTLAGLEANTYNIALAWNGGVDAAISGKSPSAARRYAERANNLASALEEPAVVAMR